MLAEPASHERGHILSQPPLLQGKGMEYNFGQGEEGDIS